MEERRSHFVLVHGACHGAWCWFKVATLLKSAGYKVTALDLAASGVHPKQVHELRSISDYCEPLMELLKCSPSGERVILVGHSLGGACISVAMERFPEKICAGVFVAAFMFGPETSFSAVRNEHSKQVDSYMDSRYPFNNGTNNPPTSILFGPNLLSTKLYQLSPPEDLMLATLLVRPARVLSNEEMDFETVVTKEKYGSVTRVYIVCDQDKIIGENVQRWMIRNSPPHEVKVIPGSDHMPMFSKPSELCSCLREIAEKYF